MKNLLFITADQLSFDKCGYTGDPYAITPNIDKLAGESFDFYNCVASHPVCAAFRASLFTGKYTTSTGMVINEVRMNPEHHPNAFAKVLGRNGVRSELIGKWHLWANRLGDFNNVNNSFVPKGDYRFGFDGFFAHCNMNHEYYKAFYHLDTNEKIKIDGYEPDFQTDMALERIEKAKADGTPLALFMQYGTPHAPWDVNNVPKEYLDKFKHLEYDVPKNYSPESDPHSDGWSNEKKTPEEIKRIKPIYYAMLNNLDDNIGRLIAKLKEQGLYEDTIIVFTSDHGEMFGAHGRRNKNIFYEEAARIPMLVRMPGAKAGKSDAPISNVDFMPTILELMGIDLPPDLEGMSVAGQIIGANHNEPEFAFLQNTGACAIWGDGHEWRAVRDKRFTYAIFISDKKEELYDNIADPLQMNNLVSDSNYTKTLELMRKRMREKMTELSDEFVPASYYNGNWINDDRIIVKTAKNN